MATQHATISPAAPASLVGNAFVIRYYNILHQTPHLGYRFYTEESRISRAELRPETAVESATSLSAIHEKIMSLDYHATRTEIMTVDTQESLAGSVLVMVTGALYNAGGVRRMFVQTFVLVPQEKSYFIFNDMFKFLDGDGKSTQQLTPPVASDTPKLLDPPANSVLDQGVNETAALPRTALVSDSIETAVVSDVHTSEYSSSFREQEVIAVEVDHYKPPLQTEVSDLLEGTLVENAVAENIIEEQGDVFTSKSNEYQDVVEEANVEEAPKKSYASILRLQKDSSKSTVLATSAAAIPKLLSTHIERSTSSAAPQAVQSAAQFPSGGRMLSPDQTDEMSATEAEGDGRSVYVKSLPLNVTVSELEEEFSKFGQLKRGGVNLRNQRIGVCYAFIEFEETSSAQCAMEASPINMNGRQVYIEEKKIFPSRGGRSRLNQGRGYQSEGMRGRGFFNNGRVMGRIPLEADKDTGRGRGIPAGRNGYGGGSFHVPNAFRRLDSQNGNTYRPMRRAGNQMGRNGPLARNGIMVAAA